VVNPDNLVRVAETFEQLLSDTLNRASGGARNTSGSTLGTRHADGSNPFRDVLTAVDDPDEIRLLFRRVVDFGAINSLSVEGPMFDTKLYEGPLLSAFAALVTHPQFCLDSELLGYVVRTL
jgi:hypothetical protein